MLHLRNEIKKIVIPAKALGHLHISGGDASPSRFPPPHTQGRHGRAVVPAIHERRLRRRAPCTGRSNKGVPYFLLLIMVTAINASRGTMTRDSVHGWPGQRTGPDEPWCGSQAGKRRISPDSCAHFAREGNTLAFPVALQRSARTAPLEMCRCPSAKAGTQRLQSSAGVVGAGAHLSSSYFWVPAFAGMTAFFGRRRKRFERRPRGLRARRAEFFRLSYHSRFIPCISEWRHGFTR
jgi:hypothetical protein